MLVLLFEDAAVHRLGLLTACRPACDLTIGATTLHDSLAALGSVERVLRPHLARYVTALAGRRIALWGGAPDAAPPSPTSSHGEVALVVNARVVPGRDTIVSLRSMVEAGRRQIVRSGDAIAAALLHLSSDGRGTDDEAIGLIRADARATASVLDGLALPAADVALGLLDKPHEIIAEHERVLEGSLAMKLDTGRFHEVKPGLFVAADADVADEVVVRQGPVVVAAGARVGPFVCLDGPLWVGPGAGVNPHAWLRAGTSLARECRAGGEIEATVMEPFSNKAHDGFLGHSHVGSWVNLAAGTVTGNLKATYGPVRLHELRADGSRTTVHTGRQFFGALVGDLVKTAINSSIPCGARIGIAATVQATVGDIVPAFANDILGGRSTAAQVATVLERMMARRGLQLVDADRELLVTLAAGGSPGG